MIQFDEAMLTQVATDVCETMLGLSLHNHPGPPGDGLRFVATVRITGETAADVEIETVREVARQIASQMFSMNPEELEESDLRDALAEIVNMVGGNLKGSLCGEFALSLPKVEERDGRWPVDASLYVQLSCDGLPFNVRLIAI